MAPQMGLEKSPALIPPRAAGPPLGGDSGGTVVGLAQGPALLGFPYREAAEAFGARALECEQREFREFPDEFESP